MLTKEELAAWIRNDWARRGWTIETADRVGIEFAEMVKLSVERSANLDMPFVDLWIAILDEFISWQVSLLTVVYSARRSGPPLSDLERSVAVILMKIIADATAIRHLVLLGYDTSAQAILRSTSEYMEVLVALLDEPSLAAEFVETDTPEGAKAFWEKHLRADKIRRRMKRAWRRYVREQPEYEEMALWFAGWGAQFHLQLSGVLHPSFAGGSLTALAAGSRGLGEDWLGVWGDRSNNSVTTIFIYGSFMFPLLMLHDGFPFHGFEEHPGGIVAYDENDELHRHVRIGRHVLASLILSLSKESNRPHVFPDEDWSWLDTVAAAEEKI